MGYCSIQKQKGVVGLVELPSYYKKKLGIERLNFKFQYRPNDTDQFACNLTGVGLRPFYLCMTDGTEKIHTCAELSLGFVENLSINYESKHPQARSMMISPVGYFGLSGLLGDDNVMKQTQNLPDNQSFNVLTHIGCVVIYCVLCRLIPTYKTLS